MGFVRLVLFLSVVGWFAAYYRNPENWTALTAALLCVASWVLFELDRGRRTVNKMIDPSEENSES